MSLAAKETNLQVFLTLQDHRISLVAKDASVTFGREALADVSLEHLAKHEKPGAFMFEGSISGDTSVATDLEALEMLRGSGYGLYQKIYGNTAGSRGLLGECRVKGHNRSDPANQLSTFESQLAWRGHVASSYLLGNHMLGGALTASANGVAVQLPAVAADEEVVAGLVEPDWPGSSGTGRTLDAKTQTATDEPFTAGLVDRHTFTQITTASASEWATPIPGPLASLWWRLVWTVGGTPPINYFPALSIGIRKQS